MTILHLSMKFVQNLDLLLRLVWTTPVLLLFVASLPIPCFLPFHRIMTSFAGRGKTCSSSKRFTVPQRYFLHFYVVAVAWTTTLLGCTWFYARLKMSPLGLKALDYSTVANHLAGGSRLDYPSADQRRRVWSTVFVLLLMEAQVIRRFFETAYVFHYGRSARMHIVGYLTGIYVIGKHMVLHTSEYVAIGIGGVLEYSTAASHLSGGSHLDYFLSAHRRWVCSTVFVLLLMEAQVIRWFFETAYVFNYGQSARMHIVAYLAGIYFYIAAPLSLCSYLLPEVVRYATSLVAELIVKGKGEMPVIEFDWWEYTKPLTNLGWCQWTGAAIFIWGWIHQLRCHLILGSLRKQPRTDKYLIPCGDWFEYVSCPHYLAEIVLYAGILVATGGSDLTVLLLFLFVASNLIFAAAQTHKWYQLKFENYPRYRRAVIPKIY